MNKSLFFLHAFSYKEKTTLQIGGLVQCSRILLEVSLELSPHPHIHKISGNILEFFSPSMIIDEVIHSKGIKNLDATFKRL